MSSDRYGTGPEAGESNDPGHAPAVGTAKGSTKGGYDETCTPSGYKRSGIKRSGKHHPEEN